MNNGRQDTCESMESPMTRLLAGELEGQELQILQRHLAGCTACAELLAVHGELARWHGDAPDDRELAAMRGRVLLEVAALGTPESSRVLSFPSTLLQRPLLQRPLLLAAAALLLLVVGALAGRTIGAPRIELAVAPRSATMLEELDRLAAEQAGIGSPSELGSADYSLTNLRLRELAGGQVRVGFDVTTYVELERPLDDPLVTEALAQSMLASGPLAVRLEALEAAAPALTPRVRNAIVRVALEDPSQPVRERALERLLEAPAPDLETALLRILERETSVQMRLLALEALTAQEVSASRLEEALESGVLEGRRAILVHANDYLQQY